ncbi:MAG: SDR family NAD(P)-dependent oxidoreductase [Mycobacteriales bacterium]
MSLDLLAGRRALVTGASGGIGSAVASQLRNWGAVVVGLDLDPRDQPNVVYCDLTDAAATETAVAAACERMGGLDVVVTVAGASGRRFGDGPLAALTDEGWYYALKANLTSAFLTCRAALPRLERGSSIVTVSSVLGLVGGAAGLFDSHGYAAAKGALVSLTRAMAVSYAPRGIRVNCVAPGLVRTPMSTRAQESPAVLAEAAARQPLVGALIEPEQVAGAVTFFASNLATAVTGVVLPVDGGWTAA